MFIQSMANLSSSQALRILRARLGYTQAEVEQLTGISVNDLEAGKMRLTIDHVQAYAKLAHVKSSILLEWIEAFDNPKCLFPPLFSSKAVVTGSGRDRVKQRKK
jgi:transcriptional regulator with XRE-family HTH domain